MNIQTVSLDVTKKPSVLPVIRLRQGDRNGTTVNAELYDNGEPLSLSGKTVKFAMQSPDGTAYYDVEGTTSGNVATFAIDETYACAITGITDKAYVNVLEGSNVICSTNRVMVVIFESAEDGADPEQSYSSGITEATNRANSAAEAAEGVVLQAVPLMSETVRGGAQLGDGLSIVDGKLTADGQQYELPTMSANIKGGAKLGSGLAVADDVLSVDASGVDSGVLPVSHGGTGASTAAGARTSLDTYSTGEVDAALAEKADQSDMDTALAGKVSKSGDTMTGSLSFINDEIDRDAAAPSAKQYGQKMPLWKDADGELIGYIQSVRNTDGGIGLQITPVNEKSDGTNAYGAFTVFVDDTGETSYGVNNAANFRNAINAANKSGETFTGSVVLEPTSSSGAAYLYLDSTNLNRDGTAPSSTTVGNSRVVLRDADNEQIGRIIVLTDTNGTNSIQLYAHNENSGTEVSNALTLSVTRSGTQTYSMSNPANFRSAIGIVKVVSAEYTINSGYFVLTNSAISSTSVVICQPYYASSPGTSKYTYTVQNSSGSANIYVRDGSGTQPANGTKTRLAFLIVN